ncbi:trypsin-like peptidase domain-containing protein [Pseudomonas sp. ICMP22404]|uniref:AVAST type 1 anti-phage system protease Avs1b n=1 Tax=Pseudomonas sp. ICMP22404 TaxID=2583807 RepID=UPI00111BAF30|nr:AVAST type 1 anti-phage system protease Avs1b [Pseudomonas sp. ICMP22404]TNF78772.1 trypsin-like peptidase domain-containing protein [Pseudomonas sp. ICMP22404]
MADEAVKQATCRVTNDHQVGTGWLISPSLVVTAFHCVEAAVAAGADLSVEFGIGSAAIRHSVEVQAHDEDLDVCLLRLPVALQIEPLTIDSRLPRGGEQWSAFGYAVHKLNLGHALKGTIQQTLDELIHGVDLDLSVSPETQLTDYGGLSGAVLMVAGDCRGLLRVSVNTAVAAISFHQMRPFLEANGVLAKAAADATPNEPVGARPDFDALFEERLATLQNGYLIMDGAHGIGKSTYCQQFVPTGESIEVLGVYALSERGRGITPAHQAQPEVFFDWVNSLWSRTMSGKPAHLQEFSYPELIRASHKRLQELADRQVTVGKIGVIFIDGLNEAAGAGTDALRRLAALFPPTLSNGLVIVITGAGLDGHAASLSTVLPGAIRLTLPALGPDSQRALCVELLDQGMVTSRLVTLLCERAKGHPLYLRYLTDMVNCGASETDIVQMPAFSGTIQDYYETLWGQLLADQDAVNLLGILARLRWGIPTKDLADMLHPAESAVYVPTLTRIRHLLTEADNTEIYHASFSEFVEHKTAAVSERLQERLAVFCCTAHSGDYGQLNRVYHGLRGGTAAQQQAIQLCQQTWVDTSVTLGAEPDVLLGDIAATLAAATHIGAAEDTIRLLLLSQRLTFRYNTLFTQAAEQVALALCALGQTDQALRHVIRNGRLIAPPLGAYVVVHTLIRMGNTEHAIQLLDTIQQSLDPVFEAFRATGSIETDLFLQTIMLRLHGFALECSAGGEPPTGRILAAAIRQVRATPQAFGESGLVDVLANLSGSFHGTRLCLDGRYTPVAQLPLAAAPPEALVSMLLGVLHHAETSAGLYGTPLSASKVGSLLSDLEVASDRLQQPTELSSGVVSTLIETGASPDLIRKCGGTSIVKDRTLVLYGDNRARPDLEGFQESYARWRAAEFLDESQVQPTIRPAPGDDWEAWLRSLVAAVAWADGAARRAKAGANEQSLCHVWAFLSDQVLPMVTRPLSVRSQWKQAYAIPETIFPALFQRLAKLLLDCLPQQAGQLLKVLDQGFAEQLGLYNEGFRQSLALVTAQFLTAALEPATADALFDLVIRWRDYVQTNVENRYELIPELLQIVPLLTRLDAQEEAARTYQAVLRFSMGPSWYKEDQLSLMSSTLAALPAVTPVPTASLVQVAAYLERASGEMTFQRYVRAGKSHFIAQLCRRSLYSQAVDYFKHQTCGTLSQLQVQAAAGDLDRVGPLTGMHFPGGALEEQSALLALLRETSDSVDWRLHWALLEVYQHGDERYLDDWGTHYARLIGVMAAGSDELIWATRRIWTISQGMSTKKSRSLLRAMVSALPTTHAPAFEPLLVAIEKRAEPELFEPLPASSSHGASAAQPAAVEPAATPEAESVHASTVEESLYQPGVFGRFSVDDKARIDLQAALTLKRRGNTAAAVKAAVNVLQTLQEGGWSIWTNNHTGAPAEQLIQDAVAEADAVVRLYGPLVLDERHAQRWWIASHLIDKVAIKLDAKEQIRLLDISLEHVGHMVGAASSTGFDYLGGSTTDPAAALFDLLLWTLDHPSWERRDSAAAMLLWLVSQEERYFPQVARLAFSMDPRNRADLAAAALDLLSQRNPVDCWERLAPQIDVAALLSACRHVSRLAIFSRIVDRAAGQGSVSACTARAALDTVLIQQTTGLSVEQSAPPDYFPKSLRTHWETLVGQGLVTPATRITTDETLARLCSPLSTDVAQLLELRVAENFREAEQFPTSRWANKVGYAFNIGLYQPMSREQLYVIDNLLRCYNPNSSATPQNGPQLLSDFIAALKNRSLKGFRPFSQGLVFLDVQSVIELNGEMATVELLAHLRPPDPRQSAYLSFEGFRANDVAPLMPDGQMAICVRARPTVAYFASHTPSVPTRKFLQLIGASESATVRYHWRDGSTVAGSGSSRCYEAAMLAIHEGALTLPHGWDIGWEIRLNGKVLAVMNS